MLKNDKSVSNLFVPNLNSLQKHKNLALWENKRNELLHEQRVEDKTTNYHLGRAHMKSADARFWKTTFIKPNQPSFLLMVIDMSTQTYASDAKQNKTINKNKSKNKTITRVIKMSLAAHDDSVVFGSWENKNRHWMHHINIPQS